MKKEQYLRILEQKEKEIKKLNSDYLNSNREFKDGEKVNVVNRIGKSKKGIVKGASIRYNGEIEYKIAKEKKDGTASRNSIFVFHGDKIEKRQ